MVLSVPEQLNRCKPALATAANTQMNSDMISAIGNFEKYNSAISSAHIPPFAMPIIFGAFLDKKTQGLPRFIETTNSLMWATFEGAPCLHIVANWCLSGMV